MKFPKLPVALLLLWIVVFVLAFVAPGFIAATGDGFTRGMNRLGAFFLWQLAAIVIAIVLAIMAWTNLRSDRLQRWLFSIPAMLHLLSVLFLVGFVVYANTSKPASQAYVPPMKPTTAEAIPVMESPPAPETKTFMGIYRSGFEMSHFYTMEGEGPYWLEADGQNWEKLQSYYVEGAGRSGGVTVAMTVSAYLSDAESDLDHLGAIDKKMHLVAIDAIRLLSQAEFDQVMGAIQGSRR